MKPIDRFICRREGHKPSVTITKTTVACTWISPCLRCGKMVTVEYTPGKS